MAMVMQRLDGLSPLAVVGRGYAIVSDNQSSQPVVSVKQVQVTDQLDVMLQDGTILAEVKSIQPHQSLKPTATDEMQGSMGSG
jgi:exonuclease VII large subunit